MIKVPTCKRLKKTHIHCFMGGGGGGGIETIHVYPTSLCWGCLSFLSHLPSFHQSLVLCTGGGRSSAGAPAFFCLPEPKPEFAVFFSQLRLDSQNDFDSLNLLKVR